MTAFSLGGDSTDRHDSTATSRIVPCMGSEYRAACGYRATQRRTSKPGSRSLYGHLVMIRTTRAIDAGAGGFVDSRSIRNCRNIPCSSGERELAVRPCSVAVEFMLFNFVKIAAKSMIRN